MPAGTLGPAGTVSAVLTIPTTCSMRSPTATAVPPAAADVQPVSEPGAPAVTPVQVITEAAVGTGVWVRSTNGPATSCSGELARPVWVTVTVAGLPPVAGTATAAVAKASGSTPTRSVAGSPARGFASVAPDGVWTSRPTPALSPAGRCSV